MKISDLKPWDAAEHLKTEEEQAEFLIAAFEEGDPQFITHCIGVVARARGEDCGPEFEAVLRLLQTLGLKIVLERTAPD
jgi:DNA-binding phage protein